MSRKLRTWATGLALACTLSSGVSSGAISFEAPAWASFNGAVLSDTDLPASSESGQKEISKGKPATGTSPVIAINCDVQGESPRKIGLSALYIDAIKKAGGIPLLLPPMPSEKLAQLGESGVFDGVMMIGGDDYPPDLYGAEKHPTVSVMDKERYEFDMALVKYVREHKDLPFLGICAGCQALNIGSGGTLIQDIPSQKPESKVMHASKDGWQKGFNHHEVKIKPESKLAKILQRESESQPTSHHQCVDKLGTNLEAVASTADGVVEGLEMTDRPFGIGVQFHPERAFDKNEELFKKFVEACGAVKR